MGFSVWTLSWSYDGTPGRDKVKSPVFECVANTSPTMSDVGTMLPKTESNHWQCTFL